MSDTPPNDRARLMRLKLPECAVESPLAIRMDVLMLFEGVVMTQSPANLGVVQGRPAQ